MAKFENLTAEQLYAKEAELKSKGFTEAETISQVEPGRLDGSPVIVTKGKVKLPNFFIFTYKRDDKDKWFKGCFFNGKHLSNAKTYNNLAVGLTVDKIEMLKKPENMNKSYDLIAEQYTTTDGRKVTTTKMVG